MMGQQGPAQEQLFCAFGLESHVPADHLLRRIDGVLDLSDLRLCKNCPLKPRCCPNTTTRKIARSIHQEARDVARRINASDQCRQSRKQRRKVEVLFAHLKRILRLDRLRLRGLCGAFDERALAATAQNLRRLAKLAGRGPPTDQGLPAPA
jgi:hypothetical protein